MSRFTPQIGRLSALAWLLSCLLAVGCTTIKETYHVRATQTDDAANTNYYRIKIKGHSMGSASQYASGLYDSRAVDALFGELEGKTVRVDRVNLEGHQERSAGSSSASDSAVESGTTSSTEDSSTAAGASAPGARLESFDGQSLENRKLVLFLSSNSDALVNEISAQVTKLSTEGTLAAMMLAPEIEELQASLLEADRIREEDRVPGAALRYLAKSLRNGDGTPDKVRATLVQGLREIARRSQNPAEAESIEDVESALLWLQQNPNAFKTGGDGQ